MRMIFFEHLTVNKNIVKICYIKKCKILNNVLLIKYCQEVGLLHRLNSIIKYLNISNLIRKKVSFSKFSDFFIW